MVSLGIQWNCEFCKAAFIPHNKTQKYCSRNCYCKGSVRPKAERFWEKVKKDESGCWLWTAKTNGKYGQIFVRGIGYRYAHRVSWSMANGKEVPVGMDVCHHCDTPLCIRPDHLFVGTRKENMEDCGRKNRFKPRHGETSPFAKLKERDIQRIIDRRCNGETWQAIAKSYGVGTTICRNIYNGKKWKSVPYQLRLL
jgi:HNH endonuclease